MPNNEIVEHRNLSVPSQALVRLSSLDEARQVGKIATQIGMGSAETLLAKILAGNEIGLTPMASIRGIHIIETKDRNGAVIQRSVSVAAATLRALVRASGKCKALGVRFSLSSNGDHIATAYGTRSDTGESIEYDYKLSEAKKAGLYDPSKQFSTWAKHTKRMLAHRATSYLIMELFPEIAMGVSVADSGDVVEAVMVEENNDDLEVPATEHEPEGTEANVPEIVEKPKRKRRAAKKDAIVDGGEHLPEAPAPEAQPPAQPAEEQQQDTAPAPKQSGGLY